MSKRNGKTKRVLSLRSRRNKRRGLLRQKLLASVRSLAPRLAEAWRLWPVALFGLLALVLWHSFTHQDRFRLQTIESPVCRHISKAKLLGYLHTRPGQNIFTVDLRGAAERIVSHPWIKTATVRRELPATLVVELAERDAVALLQIDKTYLVDVAGEPFKELEQDDPHDLPLLTGFEREAFSRDSLIARRQAKLIAEAVQLLGSCQRLGVLSQQDISEIRYDSINGFTLITVEHASQVRFGIGAYGEKLRRYAAVAERLPDQIDRVPLVDLAIAGRVIVRGLRKGPGA